MIHWRLNYVLAVMSLRRKRRLLWHHLVVCSVDGCLWKHVEGHNNSNWTKEMVINIRISKLWPIIVMSMRCNLVAIWLISGLFSFSFPISENIRLYSHSIVLGFWFLALLYRAFAWTQLDSFAFNGIGKL